MLPQVENVANEEIPQIYAVCGRGPRSSLRVLRPGLAVTEMAVSPLPGNPTAVWTTKRSNASEFDNYIIVSFTNATLVLLPTQPLGGQCYNFPDSDFVAALTLQHLPSLPCTRSKRDVNSRKAIPLI